MPAHLVGHQIEDKPSKKDKEEDGVEREEGETANQIWLHKMTSDWRFGIDRVWCWCPGEVESFCLQLFRTVDRILCSLFPCGLPKVDNRPGKNPNFRVNMSMLNEQKWKFNQVYTDGKESSWKSILWSIHWKRSGCSQSSRMSGWVLNSQLNDVQPKSVGWSSRTAHPDTSSIRKKSNVIPTGWPNSTFWMNLHSNERKQGTNRKNRRKCLPIKEGKQIKWPTAVSGLRVRWNKRNRLSGRCTSLLKKGRKALRDSSRKRLLVSNAIKSAFRKFQVKSSSVLIARMTNLSTVVTTVVYHCYLLLLSFCILPCPPVPSQPYYFVFLNSFGKYNSLNKFDPRVPSYFIHFGTCSGLSSVSKPFLNISWWQTSPTIITTTTTTFLFSFKKAISVHFRPGGQFDWMTNLNVKGQSWNWIPKND